MIARNWKWIAATLLVAAIVHIAAVYFLPRLIMLRTAAGISRQAAARGVVRFRTLINDDSRIGEIDAKRRFPTCRPYTTAGG